jgi:hypothetical protein
MWVNSIVSIYFVLTPDCSGHHLVAVKYDAKFSKINRKFYNAVSLYLSLVYSSNPRGVSLIHVVIFQQIVRFEGYT